MASYVATFHEATSSLVPCPAGPSPLNILFDVAANLVQVLHAPVINLVRGHWFFEFKHRLHPRARIVDLRAGNHHRLRHRAAENLPHHRQDFPMHRLSLIHSAAHQSNEIIGGTPPPRELLDRKSTRLNSSH